MKTYSIEVFTTQDCNELCAILCRNGYAVTANSIIYGVSNELTPKQWRIEYYDPKEIEVVEPKDSLVHLSEKSKEILRRKQEEKLGEELRKRVKMVKV